MTRSPSNKRRNASVTQRNFSPEFARASNGSLPNSILKSGGKKTKKGRPKTAQRVDSGYKPTRSVMQPDTKAGLSFSPYQVPNVA